MAPPATSQGELPCSAFALGPSSRSPSLQSRPPRPARPLPVRATDPPTGGVVTSAPATPDVGQAYRPNPAYTGSVTIGGTLPSSGSQGEPQPINSLPPGFEDGTPAMQHRQALKRYWAEQGPQAQPLASANQQPNG